MASEQMKRRMQEKGLQFPLPEGPLTVIMEDEIMHTVAFPVCDDPRCICYACERQQIIEETAPKKRPRRKVLVNKSNEKSVQAPLNGNRPFNLMRS
jgi:hypothetical protein